MTDSKISSAMLSYWAIACKRASVNNHTCWTQLHRDGLLITMIGPDGARADLPVLYAELNQLSGDGERRGVIDEIISAMRSQLVVQMPVLMT